MKVRRRNEVLPDYFCENQVMKVLCSKIKCCFIPVFHCKAIGSWLKCVYDIIPILIQLLFKSRTFGQFVYSLRRWRFYLLLLVTLGCRAKGEQCSPLCRRDWITLGWRPLFGTRVHFDVRPFLFGMSVASLCNPLRSNSAWQHKLLWFSSESASPWLNCFRLKIMTFEIFINARLPPEPISLSRRMKHDLLAVKRERDDITSVSAEWIRTYLMSIFIKRNSFRYRNSSLICMSNLLE